MEKNKIPEHLIGKFTVEYCSYYPIGDLAGSIMDIKCGQIEISDNGLVKLEHFSLPERPDCGGPSFVTLGLMQRRGTINYGWGGYWEIENLDPEWPNHKSIYLSRGCEHISLHGLKPLD